MNAVRPLVIVWLALALAACATPAQPRPQSAAPRAASGVAAAAPSSRSWQPPAAVGDLTLDETETYPQREYGTKYTYGIKNRKPYDLFIYPIAYPHHLGTQDGMRAALELLRREFIASMDGAVEQRVYQAATPDDHGTVQVVFQDQCLEGIFQRYKLVKDGVSYGSDMYGFAAYGQFLKFRVSRPSGEYDSNAQLRFVQDTMAALQSRNVVTLGAGSAGGFNELMSMINASVMSAAAGAPARCTPTAVSTKP